jgi:hypothetical protein
VVGGSVVGGSVVGASVVGGSVVDGTVVVVLTTGAGVAGRVATSVRGASRCVASAMNELRNVNAMSAAVTRTSARDDASRVNPTALTS